jgi:hypothetical protein
MINHKGIPNPAIIDLELDTSLATNSLTRALKCLDRSLIGCVVNLSRLSSSLLLTKLKSSTVPTQDAISFPHCSWIDILRDVEAMPLQAGFQDVATLCSI